MEILFILLRRSVALAAVVIVVAAWTIWAVRDVLPGSECDDEH